MITFKDAITDLGNSNAFPADLDTGERKAMLNEVCERLLYSGRFLGTEATINIHVDTTGILTLPRRFKTIKGVTQDDVAISLTSKWWKYAPGADATQQKYDYSAQVLGAGFPVFTDPTEPVRLQISGDATGAVRIQGEDENGNTIFDNTGGLGFDINFEDTSPSTQYVSRITAVEMPVTDAPKVLSAVYDDTTVQVIGLYEPGETVPDYTRYYFGRALLTEGGSSITALCQRQFVRCVADTDLVYPSHFGALKHGLFAVNYLNQGEEERYTYNFNEAIRLLNSELGQSRPESEKGVIRIRTVGVCMGQDLRSRY
jgi:hypothetical protein